MFEMFGGDGAECVVELLGRMGVGGKKDDTTTPESVKYL